MQPVIIKSCSIYQNISNLPLSRFIDCIVDHNLFALVITGTPDPKELTEAWDNILQEYTEAIGANEYKLYLSLYREVTNLDIEYKQIRSFADILCEIQNYIILKNYDVLPFVLESQKKFSNELNKLLRTECKFNNRDPSGFQEEINKCLRRSKALKIKLDLKLLAFAEIQKKNKDGAPMDRRYFDSMLITISDYAKYEIGEQITVSKYCERIKRYNHYCESLKIKKRV